MTKLLCNEHIKSILLHNKLFAKVAYTCRDWVKINAPGVVSDAEVFSPRAWLMLNASEASITMEQCWCPPISLAVGALTMFCTVFCDLLHCCGTSGWPGSSRQDGPQNIKFVMCSLHSDKDK